jgi:hypothetical protein
MSSQKILIGTLIATVFVFALDFLFYGVLMSDYFANSTNLESPRFPWLIVGNLAFGFAFCALYAKFYSENKPVISQGISFGIHVTLLVFVFHSMMIYATANTYSMSQILTDTVYRLVQMIILGIIVALYFGQINIKPGMASGGDA